MRNLYMFMLTLSACSNNLVGVDKDTDTSYDDEGGIDCEAFYTVDSDCHDIFADTHWYGSNSVSVVDDWDQCIFAYEAPVVAAMECGHGLQSSGSPPCLINVEASVSLDGGLTWQSFATLTDGDDGWVPIDWYANGYGEAIMSTSIGQIPVEWSFGCDWDVRMRFGSNVQLASECGPLSGFNEIDMYVVGMEVSSSRVDETSFDLVDDCENVETTGRSMVFDGMDALATQAIGIFRAMRGKTPTQRHTWWNIHHGEFMPEAINNAAWISYGHGLIDWYGTHPKFRARLDATEASYAHSDLTATQVLAVFNYELTELDRDGVLPLPPFFQ